MAPEAVVTPPVPAPGTVADTPEFKEALAKQREQDRLGFDAEYRRKEKELADRMASTVVQPAQPTNGPDFFGAWGEKHGLPPDAGRELAAGVLDYVQGTILPQQLAPITHSQKRQELRSQRSDLRSSNPKLAKLDDRYHAEVMKLLDPMHPSLIGVDSYARALHMVIGQHIEELETEKTAAADAEAGKGREPVPGPEPTPSSGPSKPGKVVLNAEQRKFCEDKGMADQDFVDMMLERARNMEVKQGMTKNQVRARLGALLGSLEF